MNLSDFKHLLDRPAWSKDVIVWIGSPDKLDEQLEGRNVVRLDLLNLMPDDDILPSAREERAQLIQRALEKKLREEKDRVVNRTILRVENAALLARYGVGLQSFYDWFAGAHTMTVLHIDRIKKIELPETVDGAIALGQDRLPSYFNPLLSNSRNLYVEVS